MSLQKFPKSRIIITIALIGLVVALGFLGGNWQKGFAQSVPTLPVVLTISPNYIPLNMIDYQFTITGNNFISDPWGPEWTLIRWYGPDGLVFEAYPDSVNSAGTELKITFPNYLFQAVGFAEVRVINHPEDEGLRRVSGPLSVEIYLPPDEEYYLYLPLIMK